MNKKYFQVCLLTLFILTISSLSFSQTDNPFHQRRQHVIKKMSDHGLLVLRTSGDGDRFGFGFQQNSDLFYLTGMDEPHVSLILSKNGIKLDSEEKPVHSILLIARPEDDKTFRHLADSLKFDIVCNQMKLRRLLADIIQLDTLYTNLDEEYFQFGQTIFEKTLNKFVKQFKEVVFQPATKLTSPFRRIKDETEIALIQKAIDITANAHRHAFQAMRPGLYEYQIEGVIEFVFKANGSKQLAFPSIVGSGPNSLILHYDKGERKIEPGDLVVVDIGCEFGHYCADITRTIPATGKFTPEQREIYDIVLRANKQVIHALKPGITIKQMNEIANQVIKDAGYGKYIRHSCTHYLGLDVHDVGDWKKPLESGCVVTVEPGIYIQPNDELDTAYWNIGIRIEDDVLITEDGHRVLTEQLPKSADEIELLMQIPSNFENFFRNLDKNLD